VVWVQEIQHIIVGTETKITRILREGNKVADHLVNKDLDDGAIHINKFQELTYEGKRLINGD